MHVIKANAGLLSNYEVYLLLKQEHTTRSQKLMATSQAADFQDLYTVEFEAIRYLETSSPAVHQTPEHISAFLKAVEPFRLTKAEKLSLLNMRPVAVVELFMIVDECETRLSADEIDQLLQTIQTYLPLPVAAEEDGMAVDGQESDAPLF